jgi:uncharacterized protein (TIGR00255 family)
MPEGLEDHLLGHFGGAGTVGVSPHAIHHDEQRSVLGDRYRDPVLVFLAPSEETYIGVFQPQVEIRASVRLVALYITLRHSKRSSHRTQPGLHAPFNRTIPREPPRMIASMTGFARREVSGSWGALVCELRSVNHRFLEPGFRLPDELRAAEPEFRQRLSRELKRGKVDCSISYRRVQGSETSLEVDTQALERLLARVREVARAVPDHTVNVLEVLRWPGVLREDSNVGEELMSAAHAVFGSTLQDLAAARSREGQRLKELIEQRCSALEALVTQVRARLPEVQARIRARLDDRLAELQANVDRERLEQELALLLQRLDVDEELDRLSGHVVEIRRVVSGGEPAGRRLDFLMQELNREANTLSSKSQDLDTTRCAVDMKVIIEQMREQVQNVE